MPNPSEYKVLFSSTPSLMNGDGKQLNRAMKLNSASKKYCGAAESVEENARRWADPAVVPNKSAVLVSLGNKCLGISRRPECDLSV